MFRDSSCIFLIVIYICVSVNKVYTCGCSVERRNTKTSQKFLFCKLFWGEDVKPVLDIFLYGVSIFFIVKEFYILLKKFSCIGYSVEKSHFRIYIKIIKISKDERNVKKNNELNYSKSTRVISLSNHKWYFKYRNKRW